MRISALTTALFFYAALSSATVMAAEETPATAPTNESNMIEVIDDSSASGQHKDCPMHQGKKELDHKNGEPCPYHQGEKHHNKAPEKCDHKQHG